ncbi:MAG TPA: hypothetical protein VE871_13605, partial [Longimicrobium sp.]|nr:hypothetical protein [Longimicrobium sp.]
MANEFLGAVPDAGLAWLRADGPHSDIVLSTRIRLARNLQHFRFGTRAEPDDRREVLRLTLDAAGNAPALGSGRQVVVSELAQSERQLLLERHLVSRELIGGTGHLAPSHTALLMAPGEALSVMVNEEDHLRLQNIVGG